MVWVFCNLADSVNLIEGVGMGSSLSFWFRLVRYTVAGYQFGLRLYSFFSGYFARLTSIGKPEFACFLFIYI